MASVSWTSRSVLTRGCLISDTSCVHQQPLRSKAPSEATQSSPSACSCSYFASVWHSPRNITTTRLASPAWHQSRASTWHQVRNVPAPHSGSTKGVGPSPFLGTKSTKLQNAVHTTSVASLGNVRKAATGPVALLELFAFGAFAAAALGILVMPIVVTFTAVAGAMAATATALAFALLTPLLPLTLASFGFIGLSVPFVWNFIDACLFVVVLLNFVGGVIGLANAQLPDGTLGVPKEYRNKIPKRVRKMLEREGIPLEPLITGGPTPSMAASDGAPLVRRGFWFLPTVLSLVPGLHGAGWLVAFSEWPSTPTLPSRSSSAFRAGLLRNALVYGGTGLLGLLIGHPFGAPAAVTVAANATCLGPFCFGTAAKAAVAVYNTGSFWLSVCLGAAHLQLDRKWIQKLGGTVGGPVKTGARGGVIDVNAKVQDAATESELSRKELEDFDARLRYRTKGGSLGTNAAKWTTAEVALWLQDSGFAGYADMFQENDINGAVLLSLTDDELRDELGMVKFGQRRRLQLLLQELRRRSA